MKRAPLHTELQFARNQYFREREYKESEIEKHCSLLFFSIADKINARGKAIRNRREFFEAFRKIRAVRTCTMANTCLINGPYYGDEGKLDERTRKYCEEQYDLINEP